MKIGRQRDGRHYSPRSASLCGRFEAFWVAPLRFLAQKENRSQGVLEAL